MSKESKHPPKLTATIALLILAIAANQTDPPPPERGSGRRDYVEEIAYIKNC